MPFFFQPHIYFIFLRFWVFVGTVFPHCSHLSGLDFSKKCSFSAFLPQILSKKINWESVAVSRCGPTVFLIFAQGFGSLPACLTLFLVTPTFHVLYLILYVHLYMKQTMLCSIKIRKILLHFHSELVLKSLCIPCFVYRLTGSVPAAVLFHSFLNVVLSCRWGMMSDSVYIMSNNL